VTLLVQEVLSSVFKSIMDGLIFVKRNSPKEKKQGICHNPSTKTLNIQWNLHYNQKKQVTPQNPEQSQAHRCFWNYQGIQLQTPNCPRPSIPSLVDTQVAQKCSTLNVFVKFRIAGVRMQLEKVVKRKTTSPTQVLNL